MPCCPVLAMEHYQLFFLSQNSKKIGRKDEVRCGLTPVRVLTPIRFSFSMPFDRKALVPYFSSQARPNPPSFLSDFGKRKNNDTPFIRLRTLCGWTNDEPMFNSSFFFLLYTSRSDQYSVVVCNIRLCSWLSGVSACDRRWVTGGLQLLS